MNILLSGALESFLQLVGALLIFAFVLVLVYLVTRWMGVIQKGQSYNKNLHIVETIGVGNNKMISIVEAGTQYLVVAIGKDEIHLLAKLSREELKDFSFEEEKSPQESFSEVMKKLKEKLPKKQD
ncbi:MAG: flagellar biosynthetic protein FliO [Lachnospiraceae bacterium]|nr:flagellar biosynthetic protein FliO [Lachnospiraceae bacterium]